ncbi:MAG: response regulator [Ardenticatenaceae bacterium]|nr:response regulator [Ardenticatenaceae bacterium]
MADEKKILVVDDHFEMLEFLRSMLELSNQDFEVLAVPSAEEGLLELRRVHFDLVITDVRLPGMSGFDLVRRTKSIKSDIPVIMITAYSSAQGKQEAEDLGVFRYFPKPLDTDEMLSAVHQALYGESVTTPKRTAVSRTTTSTPSTPAMSDRLRKRLDSLRNDTGANQLILATLAGEVVLKVGDGRIPDPATIIKILAQTIADSFLLANELESREPFTLQFHAGSQTELYAATVGRNYFLAMFFDVQARRGRIGTVWVFAQRAIKELLELLPGQSQPSRQEPVTEAAAEETAVFPQPVHQEPVKPEPEPEPVEEDWLDIEPEELANLLASEAELPNSTGSLDAFWDDALAGTDISGSEIGLSFEEAQRRGLFPKNLNLDSPQES